MFSKCHPGPLNGNKVVNRSNRDLSLFTKIYLSFTINKIKRESVRILTTSLESQTSHINSGTKFFLTIYQVFSSYLVVYLLSRCCGYT